MASDDIRLKTSPFVVPAPNRASTSSGGNKQKTTNEVNVLYKYEFALKNKNKAKELEDLIALLENFDKKNNTVLKNSKVADYYTSQEKALEKLKESILDVNGAYQKADIKAWTDMYVSAGGTVEKAMEEVKKAATSKGVSSDGLEELFKFSGSSVLTTVEKFKELGTILDTIKEKYSDIVDLEKLTGSMTTHTYEPSKPKSTKRTQAVEQIELSDSIKDSETLKNRIQEIETLLNRVIKNVNSNEGINLSEFIVSDKNELLALIEELESIYDLTGEQLPDAFSELGDKVRQSFAYDNKPNSNKRQQLLNAEISAINNENIESSIEEQYSGVSRIADAYDVQNKALEIGNKELEEYKLKVDEIENGWTNINKALAVADTKSAIDNAINDNVYNPTTSKANAQKHYRKLQSSSTHDDKAWNSAKSSLYYYDYYNRLSDIGKESYNFNDKSLKEKLKYLRDIKKEELKVSEIDSEIFNGEELTDEVAAQYETSTQKVEGFESAYSEVILTFENGEQKIISNAKDLEQLDSISQKIIKDAQFISSTWFNGDKSLSDKLISYAQNLLSDVSSGEYAEYSRDQLLNLIATKKDELDTLERSIAKEEDKIRKENPIKQKNTKSKNTTEIDEETAAYNNLADAEENVERIEEKNSGDNVAHLEESANQAQNTTKSFVDLAEAENYVNEQSQIKYDVLDENAYADLEKISQSIIDMNNEGKTETLEYISLIKQWIKYYEIFSNDLNSGKIESTVKKNSRLFAKMQTFASNAGLNLGYGENDSPISEAYNEIFSLLSDRSGAPTGKSFWESFNNYSKEAIENVIKLNQHTENYEKVLNEINANQYLKDLIPEDEIEFELSSLKDGYEEVEDALSNIYYSAFSKLFEKNKDELSKTYADYLPEESTATGYKSALESLLLEINKVNAAEEENTVIEEANTGAVNENVSARRKLKLIKTSGTGKALSQGQSASETVNVNERFLQEGINAALGYAEGMLNESVLARIREAATQMALEALDALRTAQESHSPARKFIEEGLNAGNGYAEGILESIENVVTAVEMMVESAIEAAKNGSKDFEIVINPKVTNGNKSSSSPRRVSSAANSDETESSFDMQQISEDIKNAAYRVKTEYENQGYKVESINKKLDEDNNVISQIVKASKKVKNNLVEEYTEIKFDKKSEDGYTTTTTNKETYDAAKKQLDAQNVSLNKIKNNIADIEKSYKDENITEEESANLLRQKEALLNNIAKYNNQIMSSAEKIALENDIKAYKEKATEAKKYASIVDSQNKAQQKYEEQLQKENQKEQEILEKANKSQAQYEKNIALTQQEESDENSLLEKKTITYETLLGMSEQYKNIVDEIIRLSSVSGSGNEISNLLSEEAQQLRDIAELVNEIKGNSDLFDSQMLNDALTPGQEAVQNIAKIKASSENRTAIEQAKAEEAVLKQQEQAEKAKSKAIDSTNGKLKKQMNMALEIQEAYHNDLDFELVDNSQVEELDNQFTKIIDLYNQLWNSDASTSELERMIELVSNLKNSYSEMSKVNIAKQNIEYDEINAQLDEIRQSEEATADTATSANEEMAKAFKNAKKSLADYIKYLSGTNGEVNYYFENLQAQYSNLGSYSVDTNGSEKSQENAQKAQSDYFNALLKNVDSYINGINKKLSKIDSSYFSDEVISINSAISLFIKDLNDLQKNHNFNFNSIIEPLNNLATSVSQDMNTINNAANPNSISKLYSNISRVLSDNPGMSSYYSDAFGRILKEIDDINESGNKMSGETFTKIANSFQKINAEFMKSGELGKNIFQKFSNRILNESLTSLSYFFNFQQVITKLQEVFENVLNVNTALTELKKVSDATDLQLSQALESAKDTAKELGASIADVVQLQSDWSRLGYSIADSEELARITQLYSNVGDDLSTDSASEYLISTLRGFEIAADDAESIVDRFNEVSNNYAIDTAGLGEALERSAASFNAANTDLSESIALVTTANSIVQDPDSVGTVFKTKILCLYV